MRADDLAFMDRTERLYHIERLLRSRVGVSFATLQSELGVSRATLTRDLTYLRERLNQPIVFDRDLGGYRLEPNRHDGTQIELPGLWFSDREIHALLTMSRLLAGLDAAGLLRPHIEPLIHRLDKLLGVAHNDAEQVRRRVLIVGLGKRPIHLAHFEHVGSALLRRKRLYITYSGRSTATITEREISPLRLVHYRENWYLESWCHVRKALRNFSVDAIQRVATIDRPAKEISVRRLDLVFGPSYGIFTGARIQWAKLRFSPERARWVACEEWHPRQKGRFVADGHFRLDVPYADHRELMMDILKHGRHCEVLGPESLRSIIASEVREMAKRDSVERPMAGSSGEHATE
jgi:predicted DNA-binding transcriptional regulator YafY